MATRARICLIDDEIYLLEALAAGLVDAGFEVFTAPGAVAGLDLIGRERVDAVVTDMKMPGTDGAQFIAAARAQWPGMPIVAISGGAALDESEVKEMTQAADAVMIKPFKTEDLVALLTRLIAARAP